MADVKVTLEATTKEFAAALEQSTKVATALVAELKKLEQGFDKHKQSTQGLQQAHRQTQQQLRQSSEEAKSFGEHVTASAAKLFLLYQAAKTVFNAVKGGFTDTVSAIDEFQKGTIATAIAITNLASPTLAFGRSWEETFKKNLDFTRGMFIELERVAARYFASASELQLAYNTLAQRGVIIRREELDLLGQLTDTVLLLTGGQQSSIQIQEEIRSLLNGSARATAQLSQIIKAFGLNVKDVAAEIRATQSLKPLEPILAGAKAANPEVQKTFQAVVNGLEVAFRQVQRVAGFGFFDSITKSVQRLADFIANNQALFVKFGSVLGTLGGRAIEGTVKLLERFTTAAGAKDAFRPIVTVVAAIQVAFETLSQVGQNLIIILSQVPRYIDQIVAALSDVDSAAKKTADTKILGVSLDGKAGSLFSPILKFLGGLTDILPQGKVQKVVSEIGKINTELKSLFKTVDGRPFPVRIKEVEDKINSDLAVALKRTQDLSSKVLKNPGATQTPFTESDESKVQTRQLNRDLLAATIRADRATLALNQFKIAANIEVALQSLRRTFTLLERGFQVVEGGAVTGINSVEKLGSTFETEFAAPIARGFRTIFGGFTNSDAIFAKFRDDIAGVTETINTNLFQNLLDQSKTASDGFRAFVNETVATADDLRRDTTGGRIEKANDAFDEVKREIQDTIEVSALAVDFAQRRLNAIKAASTAEGRSDIQTTVRQDEELIRRSKISRDLIVADLEAIGVAAHASGKPLNEFLKGTDQAVLQAELDRINASLVTQTKHLESSREILGATAGELGILETNQVDLLKSVREKEFSSIENQTKLLKIKTEQHRLDLGIAAEQERLIINRAQLTIEQRKKELYENQARILQQIQSLQGKGFELGVSGAAFGAQNAAALQQESPRSEVQQIAAPIAAARVEFTKLLGAMDGGIKSQTALVNSLSDAERKAQNDRFNLEAELLGASGAEREALKQNIDLLTTESGKRRGQIDTLNASIPALEGVRNEFVKVNQKLLDSRDKIAAFSQSLNIIGKVVDNISNVLTSAITDSFEGKKTDFAKAFKGVADSLFKDSAKILVDNLKTSIQDGLKAGLKGLNLSDSMVSTLGPAFLAGFALIASFVLGQLLNGGNSNATAGNPTVGIQSTEQVRGIIGGETQIPIGLVGESLQDALVPTNLLLSRIAAGVERINGGGLNSTQLQDLIGQSISDALQIQG